ncbi:4-phosphoerythronate dehydrogenase [Rubricoccus marinus]|uniref:Erythronate-4-phosphate dehydrogenase n=1 Tax=Rubricoccus marinus TaxID=716817 RepID=A0A259TYW2_9BACT|nr:4-phosphoerythronate dehydrogenase [Rubricoccus marinus]OZC02880.1 hypothetical protein BSZ36_07790 [Rubricoccus marinus]
MLHIVADANIPHAREAFSRYGTVTALPGREITPEALSGANVLLVRSVTPVSPSTLVGTPVRFVASATAGMDHVAAGPLAREGIGVAHAPGSNAASVVDWVVAALLRIAAEKHVGLEGKTLGVVGVGAVGGRLADRARALGVRVLRCDPPRAERGDPGPWVPLATLLDASDIVTVHTPLAREAPHATLHLLGAAKLGAMRDGAWLVNAARGPVVDGDALFRALASGRLGATALDVWEGEPVPNTSLASRVDIATPHIAGYAFDGKIRGTVMVEAALREWLSTQGHPLPEPWDPESALAPEAPLVVDAPLAPVDTPEARAAWLDALVRQAYDIRADDRRFRGAVVTMPDPDRRAVAFAELRRTYPVRREWSRYRVRGHVPEPLVPAVTRGLGMALDTPGDR